MNKGKPLKKRIQRAKKINGESMNKERQMSNERLMN